MNLLDGQWGNLASEDKGLAYWKGSPSANGLVICMLGNMGKGKLAYEVSSAEES